MSYSSNALSGDWALVLGASSGFGEAVSLKLARCGMNIIGIHMDRKTTMPNVERIVADISEQGGEALFFNINAADASRRSMVMDEIEERLSQPETGKIRILMHSLAFGSLKKFVTGDLNDLVDQSKLEMTLDVMAHSLVYWTQEIITRELFAENGRIFGMTSAGDEKAWPSYGAVSAAKAALEAHIRQLALELAPMGITANAIRAGVTDTPALRKIPEAERMVSLAQSRNPSGRLTLPEDVADAIAILSHPDSRWMTGNVISVDGGESIAD